MTLERAIAKSPIGAAARPNEHGGSDVVAMRIKGKLCIVRSLVRPICTGSPRPFDFASKSWTPVERVA